MVVLGDDVSDEIVVVLEVAQFLIGELVPFHPDVRQRRLLGADTRRLLPPLGRAGACANVGVGRLVCHFGSLPRLELTLQRLSLKRRELHVVRRTHDYQASRPIFIRKPRPNRLDIRRGNAPGWAIASRPLWGHELK